MKKAAVLLLLLLAAPHPMRAAADDVDSTLLAYYNRINKHIREPWILQSADSLYRLAGEKGDIRMQAVAYTFKADHYYYTGSLDSLKAWVPRVQRFARENNQLKYYYFAWTRLATFYIKQGQYTMAVLELEKILKQAEKDGYKDATAKAYTQLGHIYRTKSLHKQAIANYRTAIDYIEQNDLDKFSLSLLYCNLVTELLEIPQHATEIPHLLERAEACVASASQSWAVKRLYALYYLNIGQYAQASALIEKFKDAAKAHQSVIPEIQLLELELIYANQTGDMQGAKRLADEVIDKYRKQGADPTYFTFFYVTRAHINRKLGNYRAAFDDLQTAYGLQMKKNAKETASDLDEFATLLGVEQLARDNAELEKKAQEQQLKRIRTTLAALSILLLLCSVFIWAQWRMTRRLAAAKRAAEEADRMKGVFIRNVTHEINTPLNSVVGFARIATRSDISDDERTIYLNIIEENSGYLQKLVDDVLCISDLETTQGALAPAPENIDACCMRAIEKACAPGTSGLPITFQPHPSETLYAVSAYGIVQVLANLLHNARKFTENGSVELFWEPRKSAEGKALVFTVTDTGCGIPAAEAERIFGRFIKLDPYGQGMGLGLSVCRLVARQMGGDVWLDTAYTRGARFVFSVPML